MIAYFDRFDICEAYAAFDMLWGPTPYGARLHRMGFKPSVLFRLETMSENAKAIYGALVRRRAGLIVAFERYARRAPHAPQWPGTYNMPGQSVTGWLNSKGILGACLTYVPEATR